MMTIICIKHSMYVYRICMYVEREIYIYTHNGVYMGVHLLGMFVFAHFDVLDMGGFLSHRGIPSHHPR